MDNQRDTFRHVGGGWASIKTCAATFLTFFSFLWAHEFHNIPFRTGIDYFIPCMCEETKDLCYLHDETAWIIFLAVMLIFAALDWMLNYTFPLQNQINMG